MVSESPTGLRICYSSDIHGNLRQYKALAQAVKKHSCDLLILGGDILPRRGTLLRAHENISNDDTIILQRKFFEEELLPLLLNLDAHVVLTFGNADFACHVAVFEDIIAANPLASEQIHFLVSRNFEAGKVVTVQFKRAELVVVGLPLVVYSPHRLKDWERADTVDTSALAQRNIRLNGLTTCDGKFSDVSIDLQDGTNSIENAIQCLLPSNTVWKDAVFVMHSPPHNTCLDLTKHGDHVGSVAILESIRTCQPRISLHGHIHETVEKSGSFVEQIGCTISMASGNDPHAEGVQYLVIDYDNPHTAQRFYSDNCRASTSESYGAHISSNTDAAPGNNKDKRSF